MGWGGGGWDGRFAGMQDDGLVGRDMDGMSLVW